MMLAGAISFIPIALVSLEWIPEPIEYPIGSMNDMDISSNGDIFIHLDEYGVVQKYNSEGSCLGHFKIQSQGGTARFSIINDTIILFSQRETRYHKYTLDVKDVGGLDTNNSIYPHPQINRTITDVNGELTYTMHNSINPQITVTDKNNISEKIIDPPFLNSLKVSPIFPLFIWSIGIGVFILNEYRKLKKSDQTPTL